MALSLKTIYWCGFLLYFKITIVALYNLLYPFDPWYLALYIASEFTIDLFIIPYRPVPLDEKIFSSIHHLVAIIGAFNEYYLDTTYYVYKIATAVIFVASYDLVCYSQILFPRHDLKPIIYVTATIRTLAAIYSPFFATTLPVNWWSYTTLLFNAFVVSLIWYIGPQKCFPNPNLNT